MEMETVMKDRVVLGRISYRLGVGMIEVFIEVAGNLIMLIKPHNLGLFLSRRVYKIIRRELCSV